MTREELDRILDLHRKWRLGEDGGIRANLAGANLAGANLAGADLAGASGVVLLTETDHGYRVYATQRDGIWRIGAGCRDFTIAEARAHWGAPDYREPLTGRRIIACLDWLEREIEGGFTL